MDKLEEQEEELRMFIKRADSEIRKFTELKENIHGKKSDVEDSLHKLNLEPVPIRIEPSPNSQRNLEREIDEHLLELSKMKNYINTKLKSVLKEEQLLDSLKKRFGESVDIKHAKQGDFEVTYYDNDSEFAGGELDKSKHSLKEMKKTVDKIEL